MSEAASVVWYTSWLMCPALRATCTRTNENSPICARPVPTRREVESGWPRAHTTAARNTSLPTTTRATMVASSGKLLSTLRTSMRTPTVTKKRATKASLRERRRARISWA